MQQGNQTLTDEERAQWVRDKFQAANKYLAELGLISDQIMIKESRYIAPVVSVWKFKTTNNDLVWVVTGDLPTDHVSVKAAATAREAIRHFSMQWQMRAETILRDEKLSADETQQAFAKQLIEKGEGLYQLSNNDTLWNEEQTG